MADYLVWSGATGANNGGAHPNDWVNAFTMLNNALSATPPGSNIIIAVDHVENDAMFSFSAAADADLPYRIIVVNRVTGVYTAASAPQINFSSTSYMFGSRSNVVAGLSIRSNAWLPLGNLTINNKFRDITIQFSGSLNTGLYLVGFVDKFDGLTINTDANSSARIEIYTKGVSEITDLVFSGHVTNHSAAIVLYGDNNILNIKGLDMSAIVSHNGLAFQFNGAGGCIITVEGGRLPAGMAPFTAGPSSDLQRAILNNISVGGILADFVYDYRGTMTTDTNVYRIGGGVNHLSKVPMSHVMRGNVLTLPHRPFHARDYIVYVDTPGYHTIEFEALEDYTAPLDSRDLYLRIEYPAHSSGQLRKVVAMDLAPATSIPEGVGMAGWQSPPSGTRSRKLVGEVTLEQAGVVRITPVLSRFEAGKSVWLDPKMIVN